MDAVPRQIDFRNNVTAAKLNDVASSPDEVSGQGQGAILLILKPVGVLANDSHRTPKKFSEEIGTEIRTGKSDSMPDDLPVPNLGRQVGGFMERDTQSFEENPPPKLSAKALTPRQRKVVELLAEGKTMKEAAHLLNVTPRTVAFHKYQVMRRQNLKTTADLIQFAIKSGILVV